MVPEIFPGSTYFQLNLRSSYSKNYSFVIYPDEYKTIKDIKFTNPSDLLEDCKWESI